MSVRPVTYYEVACDEPGCAVVTSELGGDYSAWSTPDGALVDWTDGWDGQALEDGRTFCEEHRKPDEPEHEDEDRSPGPGQLTLDDIAREAGVTP